GHGAPRTVDTKAATRPAPAVDTVGAALRGRLVCKRLRPMIKALLFLLLLAAPVFAQTGTWARQRAGTMAWLHSVYFLDQNRGWAIGSKGTLLQTIDGGNTWK